MNEENDWNKSMEITKVEGPSEQVSTEDVMEALILMNTGKAAGPSGVVKCLQKRGGEKIGRSC